jgi:hypothetical protein
VDEFAVSGIAVVGEAHERGIDAIGAGARDQANEKLRSEIQIWHRCSKQPDAGFV